MASLNLRPDGVYVDCTYGRGGHTREILNRLGSGGRVLAIDCDPSAVESGRGSLIDARFELVHERFSRIGQLLETRQLREQVDGILMDLGVSSPQLDNPQRGFSFRAAGPLDMRMNPSAGPTAAEWLAAASEKELRTCLRELGEERFAGRIARKIVEVRRRDPIVTTLDPVAAIKQAVPAGYARIDPATRTFQAIRLRINSEMEELSTGLRRASECIAVGGRIVVIAFHSLEDRIVKRYFRDLSRPDPAQPAYDEGPRFRLPARKPLRPSAAEIRRNPRSRSARLRVLERTAR
jgi:16S rRNA (cytosine1402-N4)-methyltransferase